MKWSGTAVLSRGHKEFFADLCQKDDAETAKRQAKAANQELAGSFGLPFLRLRVRVEEIYSVNFRTTRG